LLFFNLKQVGRRSLHLNKPLIFNLFIQWVISIHGMAHFFCHLAICAYLRHPFPTRLNKCTAWAAPPVGSNRKDYIMPKVKTNSSAKKRFKVTGTGEITFQKAFKRHILTKKSTKRKRAMRKKGLVGSTNKDFVLRLLRLKG